MWRGVHHSTTPILVGVLWKAKTGVLPVLAQETIEVISPEIGYDKSPFATQSYGSAVSRQHGINFINSRKKNIGWALK